LKNDILPVQVEHTIDLFSPLALAKFLMKIISEKGNLILEINAEPNVLAKHFSQIELVNYF
jgi:hypothetical protein